MKCLELLSRLDLMTTEDSWLGRVIWKAVDREDAMEGVS